MSKKIDGKNIAKNMIFSVLAQAISMGIGFILNLVVPKFIGEYDYSYWQTYILYMQYVCFFQFGLLDGFVLKYSKYDYDELNKELVRTQFTYIILLDLLIMIVGIIGANLFLNGVSRIILIILALTIPTEVVYNYISFMFQITNRIQEYAKYIIVYRATYCLLIILFLVIGGGKYYWFCLVYVVADVIVALYFGIKYCKELFIGKIRSFQRIIPELKNTLSVGIWLMLSSYAANLVIGTGKMTIQWFWDALTFGKVSLAFSLSNFVLQFVTAISVVLFPSLKRMDENKLPEMYAQIRNIISPVFFIMLLFYYPGCLFLQVWLPKYTSSIIYLGTLMPIMIYTSKVSLLTNNYLKAYRKERQLLLINVSVVVGAFIIFLANGYFIRNIEIMIVMIVIAIMVRSIVSEIFVMKLIQQNFINDFIVEFIMTSIFIFTTFIQSKILASLIYLFVLFGYLVWKRESISEMLSIARKRSKKQ